MEQSPAAGILAFVPLLVLVTIIVAVIWYLAAKRKSRAPGLMCPKCHLVNPDSALRCDCGYDFESGTVRESYLRSKNWAAPWLASLQARFLGQLLDSLIAFVVILASAFLSAISERTAGVALFAGLAIAVLYLLLSDGFRGGQSYGKRVAKTAVVDAVTKRPCTFGQSLARNLALMVLGVIDWVFIFGEKRQRLGDKLAGTVVIRLDTPAAVRG